MIFYYYKKNKKKAGSIKYSDVSKLKKLQSYSKKIKFINLPFILRLISVILLIFALARPRAGYKMTKIYTEGIDIVLTLDLSTSMKAVDFKPKNRLEAAKLVAEEFIKKRTNDRIGLVVFASESFTQCPLTLDYGVLISFLRRLDFGMIEDGTAIGMGLATAINRLKNSKAKSKIIILLTDGRNNAGTIDPITAAELAKTFNIKIYAIGMGKQGNAMYPIDDPIFGRRYVPIRVDIDEDLLKQIAQLTGGKYFRATNTEALRKIYDEINKMEKTKIEVQNYMKYNELGHYLIAIALLFLLIEIILSNTLLRKLP